MTTISRHVQESALEKFEHIIVDLTLQAPVLSFKKVDVAVFCLAPQPATDDDYTTTFVEAQKNFLKNIDAKRYIYVSSIGVYPLQAGVYAERDAKPHSTKACILLDAEDLALNLGGTVLRLAGLYGVGRYIYNSKKNFTEDKTLHLIHRDDAAYAVFHAVANCTDGAYNVHDGNTYWRSDLLSALCIAYSFPKGGAMRIISAQKFFDTGYRISTQKNFMANVRMDAKEEL